MDTHGWAKAEHGYADASRMLDVVSTVASLLALIQGTSQIVDYLPDLKYGGKEPYGATGRSL